MIKIIKKAYQVGNQAYASLEEAQEKEVYYLLEAAITAGVKTPLENTVDVAKWIVANKSKLMDILTTTPNSRPYRRKVNKPPFPPVSTVKEGEPLRVALP